MNIERVYVKSDDDGVKRWHVSGREGEETVGHDNGLSIEMAAVNYAEGTIFELQEPVEN